MSKSLIKIKKTVSVVCGVSVVGKKEYEGPLGSKFDIFDCTDKFGQDSFEKAESEMQRIALGVAMKKAELNESDIDVLLAGDLINQCTGSAYGLLDYDIPYFGIYGACSTAAQGLALGSLLIDGGNFQHAGVVASSHNCTAERQFRQPLEYGGQRAPTAQWTATAAGAFILSAGGDGPYVREVVIGRTVDKGISDANNMGAAMAPAAVDTFTRYFKETGKSPSDFDLIVSGDLGKEGSAIVRDFMKKSKIPFGEEYNDCGLLLYDLQSQDMHAGGSGCGCSACVLASHILPKLKNREYKNVLFMGTGALMSTLSLQQGQNIPGIAHMVHLSCDKD